MTFFHMRAPSPSTAVEQLFGAETTLSLQKCENMEGEFQVAAAQMSVS